MKLISMIDFVLEQLSIKQSSSEFKEAVKNYANFLKQPLHLGMFVPCDEDGNVLEEPRTNTIQDANFDIEEVEQYQKAKERVLFEGFEYGEELECVVFKSTDKSEIIIDPAQDFEYLIEDLGFENLILSETATNQILKQ